MILEFDDTVPPEEAQAYRDFFDVHPELDELFINLLYPDPNNLQSSIKAAHTLVALLDLEEE